MRCTIKPDMSVRLSGLQTGKMKCLAIKRRREKHYAVIRVAGHSLATGARGWNTTVYAPAHIVIAELKGYTVFHGKEPRIEGDVDYPFMLEYHPRGMTQEEIAELFKQKEH
jgi:hypothetical protein